MDATQAQSRIDSGEAVESLPPLPSLQRVLGVWALLAFLMSANGVFRETVLVPVAKRTGADVLSAALGVGIVLTTTRYFLRRAKGSKGIAPGRVATIWLALTLAFEIGVGRFVDHKSWSELGGNYAIWDGKLWPVVLLSVVMAPFVWLDARGQRRPRAT